MEGGCRERMLSKERREELKLVVVSGKNKEKSVCEGGQSMHEGSLRQGERGVYTLHVGITGRERGRKKRRWEEIRRN